MAPHFPQVVGKVLWQYGCAKHADKTNMGNTVTRVTESRYRIGVSPTVQNPDAWKRFMGGKAVPARLSTLADRPVSRGALVTSTMLQAVLAAVLVSLPVLFPQQLTKIVYQVTPLAAPKTEVRATLLVVQYVCYGQGRIAPFWFGRPSCCQCLRNTSATPVGRGQLLESLAGSTGRCNTT